jgi:hypothetical protein
MGKPIQVVAAAEPVLLAIERADLAESTGEQYGKAILAYLYAGASLRMALSWFFLLGVGVVVGRGLNMDFSERPWLVRAGINLTYLLVCLAVTLLARQQLAIPSNEGESSYH